MLRVGLTGNIASGKSEVARVWKRLGATVIDADVLARRAVEPGSPALAAIVREWGRGVLDATGALDRDALRAIVFRHAAARQKLEDIVHPAVAVLRDEETRAAAERGATLVVADIPLLFEVGLQDEFDRVVLVDAPAELRLERLVHHRGLEREEAQRMIAAQMPVARKRPLADVVIDNLGTLPELEARAEAAWGDLVRAAEARADAR